jgi:LuxR family maltose regulon positive regulatory protein
MSPADRRSLPRVADQLLSRPQLDRRLSEWAPLTLVRGLRGYGKTTQVAVWLESQSPADVTAVWVSARPAADDAQAFEEHLRAALHNAGIVPGPPAGGLWPSGFDELDGALLAEPLERKFVLVIDNFDHVREERALTELLSLVERHRRFHLFGCCQGHHPIEPLAAGRTRVNVIEARELLLGPDELVELARAVGRPIDRAGAERLQGSLGGCISVVRMALTSGEELTVRPVAVDEYVRAQLLTGAQDEALMRDLVRFSLAGTVSWPLFRDLWGGPNPRRLLDDLEATGLVVRSEGAGQVLFSLPAPVREALRDHFTSSAPDEAREAHRQLAGWFAAHGGPGHLTLAFHHAVAGEDWDLTDRLWSVNIVAMIAEDLGLLGESLAAVPAEALAARPSMQVLRDIAETAIADRDGDGRRATLRAFAAACTRVAKGQWETMPLGELLVLATGHMIELRLLGRMQDSAAVGDRVNARAKALAGADPTAKTRFAWFSLHRGITFSLLHDDFGAVRSYKRAWEYATGSGTDLVPSQAAANLALTYAVQGDTTQAQEWLSRHRQFDTARWPGDYVVGIGAHVAAGLLALDRLDDAAVRSEIEHVGDGSTSLELWPFVAHLYAQNALHSGRAAEALAHLDHLQATSYADYEDDDEGRADRCSRGVAAVLIPRARADLLIACGKGEKAKRLIGTQGGDKPWGRVPAARIRLLSGHGPAAAIDPLTWDPATSVRDRLEMLLLGAVGAWRRADSRNAQRLVNQALDLYGETGNLRPFATIPAADRAPLFALADRDIDPDDAVALARQAPIYPEHLALIELSPHEQSVLEALAKTSSRRAIASSLFVSINTVKTQLAAIYQKLGSATREEALTRARQHELLPPA